MHALIKEHCHSTLCSLLLEERFSIRTYFIYFWKTLHWIFTNLIVQIPKSTCGLLIGKGLISRCLSVGEKKMMGSVFSLDYENRRITELLPLGSCHLPWPIPQHFPAPSSEVWPQQPPLLLSRGRWRMVSPGCSCSGCSLVGADRSCWSSSLRKEAELICASSLELPHCPQAPESNLAHLSQSFNCKVTMCQH